MSLTVNIAGQWTSTTNIGGAGAVAHGITQDGWDLNWRLMGKTARRSDKFGDARWERFASGLDIDISCVFHEWKAQELKLLTVTGLAAVLAPTGANVVAPVKPGVEATASAAILVLSAVASTPAAANSFNTITFHAVTVDEDFQLGWTLGPDKAVWPFRGVVWPVTDGSTFIKYLTTS
jgi:hypothetical protein